MVLYGMDNDVHIHLARLLKFGMVQSASAQQDEISMEVCA